MNIVVDKLNKLGGNSAITTNYFYIFDIDCLLRNKEEAAIHEGWKADELVVHE
jgi:hypothetical protein